MKKIFPKGFKNSKLGGFLNKTRAGKAIQSVAIGAVSAIPFIGKGLSEELKSNKADKLTYRGITNREGADIGAGKHNGWRWFGYLTPSVIIIARLIWPEYVNKDLLDSIIKLMGKLSTLIELIGDIVGPMGSL